MRAIAVFSALLAGWVALLAGYAHLLVAARSNWDGELGLGMDLTVRGALLCAAGAFLGAPGVLLLAHAERGARASKRRAAVKE